MNEAIRTRNPWKTATLMLLAVLVLLVIALASMLQPATTTSAGSTSAGSTSAGRFAVHPGVHANSAEGYGGSGIANDPFIDRHAEVVATYRGAVPDEPSATRETIIDRHAEVVARYHQSNLR